MVEDCPTSTTSNINKIIIKNISYCYSAIVVRYVISLNALLWVSFIYLISFNDYICSFCFSRYV